MAAPRFSRLITTETLLWFGRAAGASDIRRSVSYSDWCEPSQSGAFLLRLQAHRYAVPLAVGV